MEETLAWMCWLMDRVWSRVPGGVTRLKMGCRGWCTPSSWLLVGDTRKESARGLEEWEEAAVTEWSSMRPDWVLLMGMLL